MYNGWGSIYWDSSVGDTAAWGLYLQQVGVADQPLVDEFTTNYIVGGDELCLAPNFDNYTSEMGAISGITSPSQGSAVFNGTTDYIETNTPFSYTNHTVAAWVYRDSNGANDVDYIFSMRDATNDGVLIFSRTYTSVSIKFNAQTEIQYTSFSSDKWHHIVATYDGTTQKLYFNGSLVGSNTFSDTLSVTANAIIGRDSGAGTSNFWDGNLANVAVWNRALSSDEINSVMWKQYQDLNTAEISGLKAWYSLDSTEVFDWYGYARNQGAVVEGTTCVNNALNALAQL